MSFQGRECLPTSEIEFTAGESEVIQGLDLVVPLMYLGEVALVIADPEFAYGNNLAKNQLYIFNNFLILNMNLHYQTTLTDH